MSTYLSLTHTRLVQVYNDEIWYTSDAAHEVRIPMLRNGAGLVGTSSAPSNTATSDRMINATYSHENLRVSRLFTQRSVCYMCGQREIRLKTDVKCSHIAPAVTEHTSNRHLDRVRALLEGFGDSAEREIMNQIHMTKPEPVFSSPQIDACLRSPFVDGGVDGVDLVEVIGFPKIVSTFWIGCDPGSNGRGSDTAYVAFCLTQQVRAALIAPPPRFPRRRY